MEADVKLMSICLEESWFAKRARARRTEKKARRTEMAETEGEGVVVGEGWRRGSFIVSKVEGKLEF